MAATVVRSPFYAILLALRTELADFLSWHASRIAIVAGDVDVPHLAGDQSIVLRVQGERPDRGAIDGGGRFTNRRTREVAVEVRSRLLTDRAGEDIQALTDLSQGHLLLEDSVCDALEVCFLSDDDDNFIVGQPMRLQQLSAPKRQTKGRDARPEWLSSEWTVELTYDRDLDLTRTG